MIERAHQVNEKFAKLTQVQEKFNLKIGGILAKSYSLAKEKP